MILQRYYEKKGHTKKALSGGAAAFQGKIRDVKDIIASKANVNFETVSYGGETFLSSEEVAINILQVMNIILFQIVYLFNNFKRPINILGS